jgi:hypothetical protein
MKRCPLLAQSGHPDALRQCPLLGVKRTWISIVILARFPDLGRHCFCTLSRALLLERITAKLDLHGAFTDRDLDQAIASAMIGLIHHHEPAA